MGLAYLFFLERIYLRYGNEKIRMKSYVDNDEVGGGGAKAWLEPYECGATMKSWWEIVN